MRSSRRSPRKQKQRKRSRRRRSSRARRFRASPLRRMIQTLSPFKSQFKSHAVYLDPPFRTPERKKAFLRTLYTTDGEQHSDIVFDQAEQELFVKTESGTLTNIFNIPSGKLRVKGLETLRYHDVRKGAKVYTFTDPNDTSRGYLVLPAKAKSSRLKDPPWVIVQYNPSTDAEKVADFMRSKPEPSAAKMQRKLQPVRV